MLDAGCGQGAPVLTRIGQSSTAVGVDFSREQLALAAAAVPGADLVQGDLTALPFGVDAFDAVVAFWSLIHVPKAERRTVVDEFARVLRPGGRVLLVEGTEEWTGTNPDWLDSGVEMQWHLAGAEATQRRLRNAGFDAIETRRVPDTLDEGDDSDGNEELPWTLLSARWDA